MCRHLAALGRPRPLHRLCWDAPHALVRQATGARLAAAGPENLDGWGLAWLDATAGTWRRHRSARPMPDDPWRPPPGLAATVAVAAVRRASPGAPRGAGHVAPFLAPATRAAAGTGRTSVLACSLNGHVPRLVGARTDAEVLAAEAGRLVSRGVPPVVAVARLTAAHAVGGHGCNLLLAGDGLVVAGAWGNSLFLAADADGVVVASEPLDEGDWQPVPDRHVVAASAGPGAPVRWSLTPLERAAA
jgi:glutamine amidotransferase